MTGSSRRALALVHTLVLAAPFVTACARESLDDARPEAHPYDAGATPLAVVATATRADTDAGTDAGTATAEPIATVNENPKAFRVGKSWCVSRALAATHAQRNGAGTVGRSGGCPTLVNVPAQLGGFGFGALEATVTKQQKRTRDVCCFFSAPPPP